MSSVVQRAEDILREQGVHQSWFPALLSASEGLCAAVDAVDAERAAGVAVAPDRSRLLRAFTRDMAEVRVVIVGQDPYPTLGHAVGLSFSVDPAVRPLPRSLSNIFRERADDLGIPPATHGDLSAWFERGVLLLNRVLSVRVGEAGSHRRRGWEQLSAAALTALAQRDQPLVAILWGADAQRAAELLPGAGLITSAHPSPLSARRGFFGSAPFSRANAMLLQAGAEAIDWSLPDGPEDQPTLL